MGMSGCIKLSSFENSVLHPERSISFKNMIISLYSFLWQHCSICHMTHSCSLNVLNLLNFLLTCSLYQSGHSSNPPATLPLYPLCVLLSVSLSLSQFHSPLALINMINSTLLSFFLPLFQMITPVSGCRPWRGSRAPITLMQITLM